MHRREIRVKIHIVQKGDTLWKIAKKYGVNFEEMKKLNSQLSNPDMIMPGMKIKVPTAGGTIKKETSLGSHNPGPGVKKEIPLTEHPFAKEKPIPAPIKEMPIKEVPIKEQPIIKEAPKAPYTPKMPLQVVPEIDINNYYMMNMQNMKIEQPQLPPKPANILPEVKEVPKKEIPMKEMPVPMPPPPVQEVPCEPQEYCVPVTPVMPGPGFCPPFGGMGAPMPMTPYMPYPAYSNPGMPMAMGPGPGVAPAAVGPPFVPQHFDMESSSFMPQMPVVNPAYNPGVAGTGVPAGVPGAVMGAPAQMYTDPAAYGQMQAGYNPMPAGYGQMPVGYPGGYEQMPAGYPAGYPGGGYEPMPAGYPTGYPSGGYQQMPAGYPAGYPGSVPGGYGAETPAGIPAAQTPIEFAPGAPAGPGTMHGTPGAAGPYGVGPGYGQIPYGYPPSLGAGEFETRGIAEPVNGTPMPTMQQPNQEQGLPVGTGALVDCGCGGPVPGSVPAGTQQNFVPPTPPIYSAPYSGPVNAAQPPFMNPYGMGPVGTSYSMPGYPDESS
jgi:morphogenetic protein associated with SpoVID